MNERDWTLLNAYSDGELEPRETEMLSARLLREPALAAELDRILALKGRVATLQTAPGLRRCQAPAANARVAIAAFAAGLLVAGAIGLSAFEWPDNRGAAAADLVLTLHSDFSARSYPRATELAGVAQAGEIAPPDLSGSNLRIVDSRLLGDPAGEAIGYHYVGQRGCRITLVAGPWLELPRSVALARRWAVGDKKLVLVADGMDPRRFAAIADYAEAATRQGHPDDQLRIALEDRTAAARPCA